MVLEEHIPSLSSTLVLEHQMPFQDISSQTILSPHEIQVCMSRNLAFHDLQWCPEYKRYANTMMSNVYGSNQLLFDLS